MTMNYDPNIRWASQKVKLVFGQWNYRAEYEVEIGGNCTGLTIIESAISEVSDNLPHHGNIFYCIMKDESGEELEVSDENCRGSRWLGDMLISAEIISKTEVEK